MYLTGGKFTIYQPITLYQKFTADLIFTGHEMLTGESVLLTDETGIIIDIVDKAAAGDNIQVFEGMLSPGFINCHCHLELSHLYGHIPEQTGLVDFILKIVNERYFDEAKILAAIDNAENQMLQNGIVAVGDICNNSLTLAQKRAGRLHYHNFIEASGFSPVVAATRFERALLFFDMFKTVSTSSVVPHAPYSVSPELFSLINMLPGNELLTIHNQETIAENDFFENKSGDFLRLYKEMGIDTSFFEPLGKTSLQTWLPFFNKKQSIILVHNVTTSAADISFIKQQTANLHTAKEGSKQQIFICLCPNANLYITNTLPNVNLFVENNCSIVLGTDSLASNHQLNILEEIKTLQKHFPQLPIFSLMQWATINGAKALRMTDKLGSFDKGKKPGVILISGMDGWHVTKQAGVKRVI